MSLVFSAESPVRSSELLCCSKVICELQIHVSQYGFPQLLNSINCCEKLINCRSIHGISAREY
jgi:hypothetical protein